MSDHAAILAVWFICMEMPHLAIIVPVYNEERTLEAIIPRIFAACSDGTEVIFVDDGSKDHSLEILRRLARPQDQVITKPNGGKGDAIRMGLAHVRARYVVIQDADTEYDPAEISLLLQKALSAPGCAVFGSRFLKPNPCLYQRFLWGNKVLSAMLSLLFLKRVTDSYTCYKLLPIEIFQSLALRSNGFEMEAEISAKCLKRGIPVIEVPISYHPRTVEEGKKIRFSDAWKGLLMMLRVRLGLL
ncbi:MAG TPA: glycosyl transferase [Candidatus Peribacter riflensis]|uniref:Family 2 glycosyl transferase n=1 Tax=Candidatus Peribacter riflensis TaxID=1735162 RepID=A0A0S1SVU2_9BACT|nr:MAG: family 2 glycosyl transferase [Candidatus Peribacter riflensis]ALM11353.1 MAG: family 2 glycosyl transferase [Candidatus Peribacter riflensis]ALM12455.1 MAG: family 2 glycosyl transferase [Candidatus Peribacter riflensis]ALM13556.1 MAG: family 2 glycosyl transferase [Candidatus Peribacter riflensis]ALM14657.1 MAG: family 2 glycosyl transferase [Candidatus Peribacter riflensis]